MKFEITALKKTHSKEFADDQNRGMFGKIEGTTKNQKQRDIKNRWKSKTEGTKKNTGRSKNRGTSQKSKVGRNQKQKE